MYLWNLSDKNLLDRLLRALGQERLNPTTLMTIILDLIIYSVSRNESGIAANSLSSGVLTRCV